MTHAYIRRHPDRAQSDPRDLVDVLTVFSTGGKCLTFYQFALAKLTLGQSILLNEEFFKHENFMAAFSGIEELTFWVRSVWKRFSASSNNQWAVNDGR